MQVYETYISNYTPQYLWDISANSYPRYLHLRDKSSLYNCAPKFATTSVFQRFFMKSNNWTRKILPFFVKSGFPNTGAEISFDETKLCCAPVVPKIVESTRRQGNRKYVICCEKYIAKDKVFQLFITQTCAYDSIGNKDTVVRQWLGGTRKLNYHESQYKPRSFRGNELIAMGFVSACTIHTLSHTFWLIKNYLKWLHLRFKTY